MRKVKRIRSGRRTKLSAGLSYAFGPPPLLEGEDAAAYDELLSRIIADAQPTDIFEEIWIRDVADLQWEILRYHRFKSKFLISCASEHLPEVLAPCIEAEIEEAEESSGEDNETLPADNQSSAGNAQQSEEQDDDNLAVERAEWLAEEWTRGDPDALKEVTRLLKSGNLTIDAAIMPAFFDNLDYIERIDQLLMVVEARRNTALREMDRHRSAFADRVRNAMERVEDREPEVIAPKSIERIKARH